MPLVQDHAKYGLIDFAPKSAVVVNYTEVPSKEELKTRQFPNATQEHLLVPLDSASFGTYPDLAAVRSCCSMDISASIETGMFSPVILP